NSIRMAHRFYLNGKLVGSSGIPASNKASYQPANTPYTIYVPLKKGENNLVLHVSNYHYLAGGGITSPIYLGSTSGITLLRDRSLMHDWVTVTALLVMGLYFFGLYLQRRKDYSLLFFSLFCLAQCVFSGLHGEKVFYILWSNLPYELVLRLQFVSPVLGNVAMYLYLYHAFPAIRSKKITYIGAGIGSLSSAYVFLFPTFVPYQLLVLSPVYSFVSVIYFIYVLCLAAWRKEEGSIYLLIGIVVLNIYGISQTVNVFGQAVLNYFPFEIILFILMMALLLSLRFSNAFKKVDALSQELIQIDGYKDEFLSKTSHEFKTPVHGIMNIAESIVKDSKNTLTEAQIENITLISATAKRLSILVNDLLDLSKLKRGELEVNIVKMDSRSAIDLIVEMYAFLIEEKKFVIVNDVPENLPLILADEVRFRQIIINLLDNAIKHTQHGMIRITAYEADSTMMISIEDTGSGMEADQLQHIFEPFRQFQTEAKANGVGLGLNIVKQLLDVQNGSISAASKKGEGSIFTVSLPMDSLSESQISATTEEPFRYLIETPYESLEKKGPTILVIDDHDVNLKILIELLESEDYTVLAVKSGEEAIDLVQKRRIDLIIVDLMMPGLSGFDVCKEIRLKFSAIQLPILIVTASHHTEEKIMAFQMGANDFLPKPFDLSELKVRVANLIALKQAARDVSTMEVAFLQSQIKPHFLFNVLNTINALTYLDPGKARQVIADLANFLRSSFDFHNTEQLIPLKQELALVRAYVAIEQVRFGDKVRVVYDIPNESSLRILPLLLQPLIENAIRHGISKRMEGGTVELSIKLQEDRWNIAIADDGVGIPPDVLEKLQEGTLEGKSVGLKNINRRLRHISDASWSITSEMDKGTKIVITLPTEVMLLNE
ncbi:MAG TPA: ATP-binding protein, partial [Rummeliibacillus sp.]|nr:ATP-binding protein [Rummeliibacillus sp.]